jgi:hypothetical protein
MNIGVGLSSLLCAPLVHMLPCSALAECMSLYYCNDNNVSEKPAGPKHFEDHDVVVSDYFICKND